MLGSKDNHLADHSHQQGDAHTHTHGVINPAIFSAQRGIWAIKWSFVALMATALFQIGVVVYSGSIALLVDTIHNFGDAATAIPLWIAFSLSKRNPSKRFTYGYGRAEDLAGATIVLIILISAGIAAFESIDRLIHPQTVAHLWAVIAASVIGFLGNEAVAIFRIRVGKEIGSAALISDGNHSRVDGITSLAVLFGAVGVWLGFPLADPIVGLLMTLLIFRIVWDSGKMVFARLIDGVDPEVVEEIKHAINHTPDVNDIGEIRVRWSGHCLYAEVNIAVNPEVSVERGHAIAVEVRHEILHRLQFLSNVVIHVDPAHSSGEDYHRIPEHAHGEFSVHAH